MYIYWNISNKSKINTIVVEKKREEKKKKRKR